MQLLNQILGYINQAIIWIVSFAFAVQIIYLFLFFLPAKKYAPAKVKHRFALVISAHNEADVIAVTLRNLKFLNYPKEQYRVFVIADNCTDDTASIAQRMGATVIVHEEEDPKRRNVGWAFRYAIPKILEMYPDVEAFIRLDADNILHPDYVDKMNDVFDSGVELARGYNHSTNLMQNPIAGVSGMWYIRDCRFNCQARSALGIGQMMVGGGMMFSAEIMRQYGWQEVGISEDAEFTMDMLLKKRKAAYQKEAIVYEDQPSTLKDLFKRNYRMGNGLFKLFFTHGLRCFGKFFISLRYSLLDVFFSMLFMPIAVLCVFWFAPYYIYLTIFHFASGGGWSPEAGCSDCGFFVNFAGLEMNVLLFIGWILLLAFVIPFILQAMFVYLLDYKRIGVGFWKLLPTMLSFPMFMIIYALGIAFGAVSHPKWKSAKRNKQYDESFIKTIEKVTGKKFLTDTAEILAEKLE